MDLLKLYISMKTGRVINRMWSLAPKLVTALLLVLLVLQKDINLNLNLSNNRLPAMRIASTETLFTNQEESTELFSTPDVTNEATVTQQSILLQNTTAPKKSFKKKTTSRTDTNLANTYSNMIYDSDKKTTPTSTRKSKQKKQETYVNRFVKVAQSEMKKYGIPASITLAQGLIESNAGESRLSIKNNNHFGMKCFSKRCSKSHCSNFTDDSHKDFFRKYGSAWESYRAHSLLLRGKRYRPLFKLGKKDYKGWAHGLKKAGYATDPHYARKLISLIENLELHRYDVL